MTLLDEDPQRVHQRDEAGLTPLHLAATDRIRNALFPNYGADPAAPDERLGATPAQWAVMDHRPAVARNLLGEKGVNTDVILLCGLEMEDEFAIALQSTPAHRGTIDLEKIPGGGLYARVFGKRTTLLHVAMYFGSEGVARILLDAEVEIDARDASGATPLQRAVARGLPGTAVERRRLTSVISLLLERGASVEGVPMSTGSEDLDAILMKGRR